MFVKIYTSDIFIKVLKMIYILVCSFWWVFGIYWGVVFDTSEFVHGLCDGKTVCGIC